MDQIEDVCADLQTVKGENAIVVKLRDGFKEPRISLTNTVSRRLFLWVKWDFDSDFQILFSSKCYIFMTFNETIDYFQTLDS